MLNLPNMITIARIVLVPVFLAIFWSPGPNRVAMGMGVLALAGLTDILDGYLARKYDMITLLGKILDPVADKLMIIAAMTSLFMIDRLPLWLVVLVLVKDVILVTGSFFVVVKEKHAVSASVYGKAATIWVYTALFSGAFGINGSTVIAVIAAVVSVLALTNYINSFVRRRA